MGGHYTKEQWKKYRQNNKDRLAEQRRQRPQQRYRPVHKVQAMYDADPARQRRIERYMGRAFLGKPLFVD